MIKAISGREVLDFDKSDARDAHLLERLRAGLDAALLAAHRDGIRAKRANEVGNYIEPFVKDALNACGLAADIPLNSAGKRQTVGYPDLMIEESDGRVTYLECKTYNAKSVDSSMRAFYFQASKNFKFHHDARHLMVSFEIQPDTRDGERVFAPVRWRLYTLEKLLVQIKHEFNASNKDMYRPESLLAEGKLPPA